MYKQLTLTSWQLDVPGRPAFVLDLGENSTHRAMISMSIKSIAKRTGEVTLYKLGNDLAATYGTLQADSIAALYDACKLNLVGIYEDQPGADFKHPLDPIYKPLDLVNQPYEG